MTRAKDISKIITDADFSGTLEITKGASGASANAAADELVLQNSGDAGLSILSPNANNSQILLGSPVANAGGIIRWTGNDNAVKIGTNNTGSTLRFHVGGFSEVMRISSAGNVGIGETDPSSELTVGGNATTTAKPTVAIVDTTGGATMTMRGQSPKIAFDVTSGGVPKILMDNAGLEFKTGTLDAEGDVDFKINSSGNVGIGLSSPQELLHLKDGSIAVGNGTASNNTVIGRIGFSTDSSNSRFIGIESFRGGDAANADLRFHTFGGDGDNGERLRITNSGFTKHSDSGTYRGVSSNYHEMTTTTVGGGFVSAFQNASYADGGIQSIAVRASSGDTYRFFEGYSGNAADREFRVDSDGTVHADGAYSSSGGDYAEMFEWKDGNTSLEDRVGKTVVLDGNQIRLSTSDDAQAIIIGVVSARPVVLGDAHDEKWIDKYETDSYGRYVFEEYTQTEWTEESDDGTKELKTYQTDLIPSGVTVPSDAIVTSTEVDGETPLTRRKLNSSYDSSQTYIPREQRKEFSPIGLVGKLRVEVGQTVGDRWIKMREISDTVHEYLVR